MKLVLDTNAYSAAMKGHREVLSRVREAELGVFLSNPRVEAVPMTLTTADRYSRLAKMLHERGRKIPSNDLWIAAQVVETGADLLSADLHFAEIDGLAWIPLSLDEEDSVRERVRRYYADEPSG